MIKVVAHAHCGCHCCLDGAAGLRAHAQGRYQWDSRKLKLPLVGDIILKATLARFARSLRSPAKWRALVQALTVVAQTVDNAFIGSRIEQMRDGINAAKAFPLRCVPAYSPRWCCR